MWTNVSINVDRFILKFGHRCALIMWTISLLHFHKNIYNLDKFFPYFGQDLLLIWTKFTVTLDMAYP